MPSFDYIKKSSWIIVLIVLCFMVLQDTPIHFKRIIRLPVFKTLLPFNYNDIPANIENKEIDGRVLSLRKSANIGPMDKGLLAAMQLIDDSRQIASGNYNLDENKKVLRVLAPLLNFDGAHEPRLFAARPYDQTEALDIDGMPLRWRIPKNQLLGYSLPKPVSPKEIDNDKAKLPTPVIRYNSNYYRELVENFSRRYNLNTALVMAIIHSESNFSPGLVSNKSAMGLMQLLPSTASDEVHRFLYGKRGQVGFEDLRIPEINIRYGTAYLHILLTRYFSNVRDKEVREICVIAAYNLGPNRFLKLYGPTPELAIENINSMQPGDFFADLPNRLPTRETRFYVEKVRRMKNIYASSQN